MQLLYLESPQVTYRKFILDDEYIKNFGKLLLLTEIRSAQTYWQIPSKS
jgi:hypothetical protein